MGHAVGEIVFHAVGVALSPFPLIAVIVILAGPKKRTGGPAFALGFAVAVAGALAGLTAIFVALHARHADHPSHWVMWVRLIIGVVLIGLAGYQVRSSRGSKPEATTPAWLSKLDAFGPLRYMGLATVLALADPKNISQLIAGALALAGDSDGNGERIVAGIVFVVLGSLCVSIPLVIHLVGGDTAAASLERWKNWMVVNETTMMALLFLLLGAKSLGEAISGLTS